MSLNADRASGLFFVFLGALLYFWIIPAQVESSEGSWLNPSSIPNITTLIISVCGVLLVIKPSGHRAQEADKYLIVGVYVCVLAVGLFAIEQVGFLYSAPGIALVVMVLMGERRPLWLFIGVAVIPIGIWYLVDQVLERSIS